MNPVVFDLAFFEHMFTPGQGLYIDLGAFESSGRRMVLRNGVRIPDSEIDALAQYIGDFLNDTFVYKDGLNGKALDR